uniref:Multifunctional methyltransferase subunit TRM112-like protein n=1 Tax=Acrobeloides nanus TaxID=290746 RepID=A0A914DUL6_9BILA
MGNSNLKEFVDFNHKKKKSVEFNDVFVKRMVPKIDYPVLVQAAKSVGEGNDLPTELPPDWENNEEFLKNLHELLMSVEIIDGELECPESGRKFMIREGIPNMLANEDEVEES